MRDIANLNGGLSIGEVARRANIRASALRYYERIGLLRSPRRVGARRVYDPEVFEVLALIQLAQDAGFAIDEIRILLSGFERAVPASVRWQSLAKRKLEEVDRRIENAQRMRALLERLDACRCVTLAECVEKRLAIFAGRNERLAP